MIKEQASVYAVSGIDAETPLKKTKKAKIDKETIKKPSKPRTVYVSGLPLDVTKEEVVNAFQKYGILLIDVDTG